MRTLDLNKVQYEKLEEDDEDGHASGSQKESASEGAFLMMSAARQRSGEHESHASGNSSLNSAS